MANSRHFDPRIGVPDTRGTMRDGSYVTGAVVADSHINLRVLAAGVPAETHRCG